MKTTEATSQAIPVINQPGASVLDYSTRRKYRNQGMSNLLRMGHCAPAVMQTLQDIGDTKGEWLVRMTAGLPGGIGNTGYECGGVTSPLIRFGLDYGLSAKDDGLPLVIYAGHYYNQLFRECNKSLLCHDILGKRRVPLPCIKVVRHSAEFYKQTDQKFNTEAITGETGKAYQLLYSHFKANDFHCAHTVLKQLEDTIPLTPELIDGTSGFIGGTAFNGLTCSAFTAGLMAVGLKLGEIEDSHFKVARMLTIMMAGGNAFSDHLNKFNRLMNIGHRMANWFKDEFGSTQCRDVTKCDFSCVGDVNRYIGDGSISTCRKIAKAVAARADMIIKNKGDGF